MIYGNMNNCLIDDLFQVVYNSGILANDTTSIEITGLDGNVDEQYELLIYLKNGNASTATDIGLVFQNDTGSNYGHTYLYAADSSQSSGSSTTLTYARLNATGLDAGYTAFLKSTICAKSGFERIIETIYANDINGTSVGSVGRSTAIWSNTSTNITNLTVKASTTDGIGAGSRIVLLKKCNIDGMKYGNIEAKGNIGGAWQLIDEQILTSNVQNVTFSGLDGDSDSIYMILAKQKKNTSSSAPTSYIYFNSATASCGRQYLTGNGTTVTSGRDTRNGFDINYATANTVSFGSTLIYAKKDTIKTGLSFYSASVSSSDVDFMSLFGQVWNDTSTNITSLQWHSDDATGGLASGSIIQLWKLNL